MSGVAFAEANQPEKALKLAGLKPKWGQGFSLDTLFTAITFAEAGELDLARECMGVKPEPAKDPILDIPGVKVWVGTVCMEPLAIPGVKVWSGTVSVNGY